MKTKYTIYNNKVWLDLIVMGVPMNSKCLYTGTSKKDCLRWLKENRNENR